VANSNVVSEKIKLDIFKKLNTRLERPITSFFIFENLKKFENQI